MTRTPAVSGIDLWILCIELVIAIEGKGALELTKSLDATDRTQGEVDLD